MSPIFPWVTDITSSNSTQLLLGHFNGGEREQYMLLDIANLCDLPDHDVSTQQVLVATFYDAIPYDTRVVGHPLELFMIMYCFIIESGENRPPLHYLRQ